mgnify:FL=1
MQILEDNLEEIKTKADTMSDFLKLEYLEICANKFTELNILKYCYMELIRLYETKILYLDALKYLFKLQMIVTSNLEKAELFGKEIEILIKGGYYERVDGAYKNSAKLIGNFYPLKRKIIDLYKSEAIKFERTNKINSLLKVYERLIPMLEDSEKNEYQKKLLVVYDKLGKVRESLALEKNLSA